MSQTGVDELMLKESVLRPPVSLMWASQEATPTSSRAPNLWRCLRPSAEAHPPSEPPSFSLSFLLFLDLKIFLVPFVSLFVASGHSRPRILADLEPSHCHRPSPSPDLLLLTLPSSRASPELAKPGRPSVVDAAAWSFSSHLWAHRHLSVAGQAWSWPHVGVRVWQVGPGLGRRG